MRNTTLLPRTGFAAALLLAFTLVHGGVWAQDEAPGGDDAPAESNSTTDNLKDQAGQLAEDAEKKMDEIAEQVDQSEKAKEYSAGVLQPIYQLAEYMSFSWFHWLAFAIMATGVVNYALQLVLAKLVVLLKSGFSMTEILSDALGLVISLVGITLVTQAATENSAFTNSPFAVLSSAAVGVIAGFIFYLWGQRLEIEAARGRRED